MNKVDENLIQLFNWAIQEISRIFNTPISNLSSDENENKGE